jgi:hypothetical protein
MADIKVDLKDLEKGLECVELAQRNGLLIMPDGKGIGIKRDPEAEASNQDDAKLVVEILKNNRDDILTVSEDPERLRQTLSKAQERMIEANRWLLTHMDLWDRLEKAYRMLFPDAEGCVMGTTCLDDAVVRCKACQGETNGK